MVFSNDTDDVYSSIGCYNPRKKRKILIVFDDLNAAMINNEVINQIMTKNV